MNILYNEFFAYEYRITERYSSVEYSLRTGIILTTETSL
jgi:hypothetical protein